MLSAPKRITRKEIRQPDWFAVLLRRFFSYFAAHRSATIAAGAIFVVILTALVGWDFYRGRQNRLAAEEYARAVALYHEGKHKEALEALKRLENYRSSFYSRLGLLYTAHTYAALQDTTKAADALQQLLAKERKEPIVRQSAYVSLAYAQEERGQCQEAVLNFAEAEKIAGPLKGDAALGKARCSVISGNLKEALASYRAFVKDQPSSERTNEISLRIHELEAKVGEGAAATK